MRITPPLCALLGALALVLAAALPAKAAAPRTLPAQSRVVTVPAAERQDCVTGARAGAGVARWAQTAPVAGVVSATLRGGGGDWDLAIVDAASGHVLNGSAGIHAREVAVARVDRGARLVLQACRRSGAGRRARLTVAFTEVTPDAAFVAARRLSLVRVALPTKASRAALGALGLDEAGAAADTAEVLLDSAADAGRLRAAGLAYDVRVADVLARDRANRRKELARHRSAGGRARGAQAGVLDTPSGRARYRTLPELQQEMKDLAAANPGLVRLFTLPLRTSGGREIMGIEIAENVTAPPDGRPAYVQVGTHHAREWPSTEATIEFGRELIDGYKRGDARLAEIVRRARSYFIPVVNVDGYDVTIESEGLNPDGSYEDPVDSGDTSGDQAAGSGAYKRKTCTDWGTPGATAADCLARTYDAATRTGLPDRGVDPNRNYGVAWGGPGSATDPENLTYHGPAPYSEPETAGLRQWLDGLQAAVFISNHTFSGLVLRPPGIAASGLAADEDRMRDLGDAMGRETGYVSQYSWQLYDTTGVVDDLAYTGLGGYGYTFEIGLAEFHPEYNDGFKPEYYGRPIPDEFGNPTSERHGGLREAYTLAGIVAIDPAEHAVLAGSAPEGVRLRITRPISYKTSEKPDDDGVQAPVQTVTETQASLLDVGAGGSFVWHVAPSAQPAGNEAPWALTCEDGAGNVLEHLSIFVARGQRVNLGLRCGRGSGPANPTPTDPGCTVPRAFARADARRAGRDLRIAFVLQDGASRATIDVIRSSSGRRITSRRIARFPSRSNPFTWKAASRRGDGVYTVRFRATDAAGRTDVRRVVVAKRDGRWAKRGTYYLADSCTGS